MTRAKASGVESFSKVAISSAVGGKPVRSKVARRRSVRRSAGGEGVMPWASSLARTKRSMGD